MKTNTNLPQSTLTQLEHWLSTVAIHTLRQFFCLLQSLPLRQRNLRGYFFGPAKQVRVGVLYSSQG